MEFLRLWRTNYARGRLYNLFEEDFAETEKGPAFDEQRRRDLSNAGLYRISILSNMAMDSRQLRTKIPAHRSTITGRTGTGRTTDVVRS